MGKIRSGKSQADLQTENAQLLSEMRTMQAENEQRKTLADSLIQKQEERMSDLQRQFSSTVSDVEKYELQLQEKDEIIAAQFEDINKMRKNSRRGPATSQPMFDAKDAMIRELQDEIEILRQDKNDRLLEKETDEKRCSELEVKARLLESAIKQRDDRIRMNQEELIQHQDSIRQRESLHAEEMDKCERRMSEHFELQDEIAKAEAHSAKMEEGRNQAVNEKLIIAGAIQEIHLELAEKDKALQHAKQIEGGLERRTSELESALQTMLAEQTRLNDVIRELGETEIKTTVERDLLMERNAALEKREVSGTAKDARIHHLEEIIQRHESGLEQEIEGTVREQQLHEYVVELKCQAQSLENKLQHAEAGLQQQLGARTEQEMLRQVQREVHQQQQWRLVEEKLKEERHQAQKAAQEYMQHCTMKMEKMEGQLVRSQSQIESLMNELNESQRIQEDCDVEIKVQKRTSRVLEDQISHRDQELDLRRRESDNLRKNLSLRDAALLEYQQQQELETQKQVEPLPEERQGMEEHAKESEVWATAKKDAAYMQTEPIEQMPLVLQDIDATIQSKLSSVSIDSPVTSTRPGRTISIATLLSTVNSVTGKTAKKSVKATPSKPIASTKVQSAPSPRVSPRPCFTPRVAYPHSPRLHLAPRLPDKSKRQPVVCRDVSPPQDMKKEILRRGMGTGGCPRRSKNVPAAVDDRGSWLLS